MQPIINDSLPSTDDFQHVALRKRTQSKQILGVREKMVLPLGEERRVKLGSELGSAVMERQVGQLGRALTYKRGDRGELFIVNGRGRRRGSGRCGAHGGDVIGS